ncbi:MAG TPA: hypothetical protein VNM37_01545, partial [Candidatus Dormibacteraeota bacterium]|nr:hypothetical protein [Candidatus Dormibacteraeota bacterium]
MFPMIGFADGVVANCTQEALQAAMQAGGKVTFTCDGTIVLTNSITVAADVILDATGHQVTISGDNRVRLFNVSSGVSFALTKLTLANGKVVGALGLRGEWVFGGGIFNDHGSVSLTDCALTNHQAVGGQGNTGLDPSASGGAAFGGAICNWGGTLNLTNCLVSLNSAAGGDAGIGGFTFGGSGEGGAIWSSNGIVNLVQTRVVGNTALGASAGGGGGNASGGALVAVGGVVTMSNSALAANVTDAGHPLSGRRSSSFSVAVAGAVYLATNTVMNCTRTTFEGNTANGGYTPRPEWSD